MRAGVGSFLYERQTITTRPGGWNSYDYKTETIPTFPIGINYVFGKPNSPHMFEAGAGGTLFTKKADPLSYGEYTDGRLIGHFSFMYRRVPVDGGFSWRIGFVPILNTSGNLFPSGAVGLGYAFK